MVESLIVVRNNRDVNAHKLPRGICVRKIWKDCGEIDVVCLISVEDDLIPYRQCIS